MGRDRRFNTGLDDLIGNAIDDTGAPSKEPSGNFKSCDLDPGFAELPVGGFGFEIEAVDHSLGVFLDVFKKNLFELLFQGGSRLLKGARSGFVQEFCIEIEGQGAGCEDALP
jgi:hypothetical protein